MTDLRLFGFICLFATSILIVQAWQQDYAPTPSTVVAENNTATSNTNEIALEPSPIVSNAEPELAPIAQNNTTVIPELAAPTTSVVENNNLQTVELENAVLRIKVNLTGGDIVHSELLDYPESLDDSTPITLLDDTQRRFFKATSHIVFQLASGTATSNRFTYQIASQSKDKLELFWESQNSPGLRLEKTIAFDADSYRLNVTERVINNTSGLYQVLNQRELVRVYNEEDHKQGFTQTFTGGVFYNPDVKYDKYSMNSLSKGDLKQQSDQAWAAMIQHYFGAAWVPASEELNNYYSDGNNNDAGYRYKIGFNSLTRDVQPGQIYQNQTTLYVGPKIKSNLEETAEGLDFIVDYGIFTPISEPLFAALNFINNYVGNWGWSIVILTFGIKLLFFYPSQISYKSMGKMREAQPKMEAIRDRYADDRQRQGQAMMELYKKEKINPAAGCLPMLIQIPVFISLYWALLESVELRLAPWALWISDLSAKDPYFILPLLMGATMYIQQKLNPQPTDPIQAKMFAYLPVVFTVFFMFFPSGLVLYWITNNILTISQQWYIYKYVLKTKRK